MSLLSPDVAPATPAPYPNAFSGPRVSLLAAARLFAGAIPAEDQRMASRVLALPRIELTVGPWDVPARDSWDGRATAVVVVSGILARELSLNRRSAAELFGAGDIIDPWSGPAGPLPLEVNWSALQAVTVAVLDGRFGMAARRWPALRAVVSVGRGLRAERLAYRTAILQLPRVEQRVLALMWEWADRWGKVGLDGVVVHVPATHELIGRLVAARRPTVSLALAALAEQQLVRRGPDGEWILAIESRETFA
jgi:CRP/FNR family transcriptional regulator, cyclic AMP receptor protein